MEQVAKPMLIQPLMSTFSLKTIMAKSVEPAIIPKLLIGNTIELSQFGRANDLRMKYRALKLTNPNKKPPEIDLEEIFHSLVKS